MWHSLCGLLFAFSLLHHHGGELLAYGARLSVIFDTLDENAQEINKTQALEQIMTANVSLLYVDTDAEHKSSHTQRATDSEQKSLDAGMGTHTEQKSLHAELHHVRIKAKKSVNVEQQHTGITGENILQLEQAHVAIKRGSISDGVGAGNNLVNFALVICLAAVIFLLGCGAVTLYGGPTKITLGSSRRFLDLARPERKAGKVALVERLGSVEFMSAPSLPIDLLQPEWTREGVVQIFEEHNVSCSKWTADMLDDLVCELDRGQARLVVRDSKLVHEASLCMIFLVDKKSGCVLQKLAGAEDSTSQVDQIEMVPHSRLLINESLHDAARRTLLEKLGLICKKGASSIVDISPNCLFHVADTESSEESLPGLPCVRRKMCVSAIVQTTDTAERASIGLPNNILDVHGSHYCWKAIQECSNIKQACIDFLLTGQATIGEDPALWGWPALVDVDCLALPWHFTDVLEIVEAHGITSVQNTFGMELMELAQLLKDGRVTLAVDRSSGHLICVEECVVCVIRTPTGMTLFADTPGGTADALPQMHKFSGESAWCAAMRWLRCEGRLSQPALQLSQQVYNEGHSGLVQQQSTSTVAAFAQPTFQYHLDEELPQCVRRLFLVEGYDCMRNRALDT